MKKSFLVLSLLFATISFAFAQDWQWAHRYGGSNNPNSSGTINYYNNQPHNLVLDNQGNSYLFGTYGTGTQVNGEDLPLFADNNCGAFVAKFDCNGNAVWHKAIARSGQNNCRAQYMILKNNHLYLQGTVHIDQHYNTYFLDTTVYGSLLYYYYANYPDSLTFPWIPFSDYTYIMELDLDGNIIDYNLLQLNNRIRSNMLFDYYNAKVPFTIDNDGNYYLLMKHGDSRIEDYQHFVIKLNDVPITDTMTPNTNPGYYMLKFDSDFNLQFIKPIIECIHTSYWSVEMYLYDMKCDSENNIYLDGRIQVNDTVTNPSYPYDIELASDKHIFLYNKNSHGIIMKMDNECEILWVQQPKDYGQDMGQSEFVSMHLDNATNNIYVSGRGVAPLSGNDHFTILGENDTLMLNYNGDYAYYLENSPYIGLYFIACYDTDGNYKWYNSPNTLGCEIGGVAAYNDKLYAAVKWSAYDFICNGTTYWPSVQLPAGQSGTEIGGYAICEWDRQGNMTDARQIYCKAQNRTKPYDTRVNSLGEIYTVGRFDNFIAFGTDTLFAHSESDMFIAKFGLPCQTYIYDTATYCYGEVVQGVTLTASGDYTFMYPEGDSVVFVHATVLPPLTIGLNDTTVCTAQQFYLDACGEFDSYQWSTGGTGCTEMLQFDNACTQSVSLTVTRGECSATRTISITAQVCDGITEPTATAMSLYPNPASGMVSIFGDGFVSATVIDISGRTLLRTTAMQLDISGLRPGEYVVKVERINGETEELKMVKE